MFQLSNLASLKKKRKRIGRGGSRGGTSGKGHKGQKARSGGGAMRAAFEGGQMSIARRMPKRGFNNKRFKDLFHVINLDRLETLFDDGAHVTYQALVEKGIVKGKRGLPIKILGVGSLTKKLIVEVNAMSASAADAITKAGGEVRLLTGEEQA